MINSCWVGSCCESQLNGYYHAKTLMASKTLSQSAHSAIMHRFTVPVCFHHCASAAAKMSLLYANALKILPIFLCPQAGENTSITPPNTYYNLFEESADLQCLHLQLRA